MVAKDLSVIPELLTPFIADVNLGFPSRPRLVKDVRLYQMPHGLGVQIRGLNSPVLLQGHGVEYAISYLHTRINGENNLNKIFSNCPRECKDLVAKYLILLFQRGLLAEGKMKICPRDRATLTKEPIHSYFFDRFLNLTSFHHSGVDAELQLCNSRAIVVTEGIFGDLVRYVLQLTGVKIDAVIKTRSDENSDSPIDIGAACRIVNCERDVLVEKLNSLAIQFPSTDLIICATRWASRTLFIELNDFAINSNSVVLFSNETPEAFHIGPIVSSSGEGCYACMVARECSIDPLAIEEELFQRSLRETSQRIPQGEFIPGAFHAASIVVQEATKYLARISPDTLVGSCITVPLLSSETRRNRFLAVPHCAACSG